jgi:ERF superfamily protein
MSDPISEQPDGAHPPATQYGADYPMTAVRGVLELKRRVPFIAKEGFNPQGSFNFRGIDQCMDTCGPIERELGLLCVPELLAETTEQVEYGKGRTLGFRTRVQVRYTWVEAAHGTTFAVGPFPGEAMDSGDKGTAKAMSVALRTMYLQLLTVPTGEPDPDQSSFELAKPEAAVSDPVVEAKLRERVAQADTRDKAATAWKAVVAAHGGDKAQITTAVRDELQAALTAKVAAMTQQQAAADVERGQQMTGGQQGPEDTGR